MCPHIVMLPASHQQNGKIHKKGTIIVSNFYASINSVVLVSHGYSMKVIYKTQCGKIVCSPCCAVDQSTMLMISVEKVHHTSSHRVVWRDLSF